MPASCLLAVQPRFTGWLQSVTVPVNGPVRLFD
jgi:hypothetical protein